MRLRARAKINGELLSFQECSLAQITLQQKQLLKILTDSQHTVKQSFSCNCIVPGCCGAEASLSLAEPLR